MPILPQIINQFTGVNIRQEPVDIADNELTNSQNADLHIHMGTIVVRLGRTVQAGPLTDLIVRRIARINATRYRIAGQNVYRETTKINSASLGTLNSELQTSIVPYQPLNDNLIWAFFADKSLMMKDDGTNARIWGVDLLPTVTQAPTIGDMSQPSDPMTPGTYIGSVTQIRFTSDGKVAAEGNGVNTPKLTI